MNVGTYIYWSSNYTCSNHLEYYYGKIDDVLLLEETKQKVTTVVTLILLDLYPSLIF